MQLVALGVKSEKHPSTRGITPHIVEEFVRTIVSYIVGEAISGAVCRGIWTAIHRGILSAV